MKKKGILLFLLLGLTSTNIFLFAQHDDRRKTEGDDKRKAEFEQFKEKRVAFITQAVGFTTEEASAFWSLYNELQNKKFELNQQQRKAVYEFTKIEKDGKKHTESEYKNMVSVLSQFKIDDAKLDEDYIAKFSKIISYEKIFRYQQAELQFARQMLRQQRGDTDSKSQKK